MMNVSELRRELRSVLKARKISQMDLVKAHDLSLSTVNKFLLGKLLNPNMSTMLMLEKAAAKERAKLAS